MKSQWSKEKSFLKHKNSAKNLSPGWETPAPWLSSTQILGNVNTQASLIPS
jgi:hypothetical protein